MRETPVTRSVNSVMFLKNILTDIISSLFFIKYDQTMYIVCYNKIIKKQLISTNLWRAHEKVCLKNLTYDV